MSRCFHISNIIELSYSAQASQHAPKDCRGNLRGPARKFQVRLTPGEFVVAGRGR